MLKLLEELDLDDSSPVKNQAMRRALSPKNSKLSSWAQKIGEKMYEKAIEKIESKKQNSSDTVPENCTFSPTLSLNSLKIMQNYVKKNRIIQKALEPIPAATIKKKKLNKQKFLHRNYVQALEKLKGRVVVEKDDQECTFTPRLDPNSLEMASSYKSNLFARAKASRVRRESLIKEHQAKKVQDEMRPCTFTPKIIRTYRESPRRLSPPKEKTYSRYKRFN